MPKKEMANQEDNIISLETIVDEHDRNVRRYRNRRYRCLKNDAALREMYTKMKAMEKEIYSYEKAYDRLCSEKMKQLWQQDSDIQSMRSTHISARRRYRRLKKRVDTALESHIGTHPELADIFFT